MFPSESVADGWDNSLPQLIAFVGMAGPVFEALEREFGELGGRIANIATIPEKVWRNGVGECKVIVQAFRAAVEVVADLDVADGGSKCHVVCRVKREDGKSEQTRWSSSLAS